MLLKKPSSKDEREMYNIYTFIYMKMEEFGFREVAGNGKSRTSTN